MRAEPKHGSTRACAQCSSRQSRAPVGTTWQGRAQTETQQGRSGGLRKALLCLKTSQNHGERSESREDALWFSRPGLMASNFLGAQTAAKKRKERAELVETAICTARPRCGMLRPSHFSKARCCRGGRGTFEELRSKWFARAFPSSSSSAAAASPSCRDPRIVRCTRRLHTLSH